MTHLPPPSPKPDLYQRLDTMASQINELMRRRLDFPTDGGPLPDCFGCLCQGIGAGSHTGLSTSSTTPLSHNVELNVSRVVDCVQGGGAIGSDSASFVAIEHGIWAIRTQVTITHSGSGVRTAELRVENPDTATVLGQVKSAGVTETGTGEELVLEVVVPYVPMYAGYSNSTFVRAWAASGTIDVLVSQRVGLLHRFLYDGF